MDALANFNTKQNVFLRAVLPSSDLKQEDGWSGWWQIQLYFEY